MKNNIVAVLIGLFLLIMPGSLWAEQFYAGLGLNPNSGQPDFVADGITNFNLAFETKNLWRFSLTNTSFKHKDDSKTKIKAMIFSAEQMWVYKINKGMTLIGAFGPGLFNGSGEGNADGSGTAVGLVATGSIRYAITSKVFASGALHYKNAAITNDKFVVDGGYTGLFVNVGYFF